MESIPKQSVQSMHSNTNSGQVILPVDYHKIYLKGFFFHLGIAYFKQIFEPWHTSNLCNTPKWTWRVNRVSSSVNILLDSTRSTEILSWKIFFERVESSKIKKWHSLDSLEFSLLCFEWVPSTRRVFLKTKWWHTKCPFDNK